MTEKHTELNSKQKFLNSLSNFLEKHKYKLLIILAVIVIALIVASVVDNFSQKKAETAALAIEDVQKEYDEWMNITDETEKTSAKDAVFDKIDSVISDYPKTYAGQKALFLKANISFSEENWADSAKYFIDSASVNRESYLAPVSLMLAASAYENAENFTEALKTYLDIVENYDGIYPDVPHAMLSAARLYEITGDTESAKTSYNNLVDKYPQSSWASFARTRLIQLD